MLEQVKLQQNTYEEIYKPGHKSDFDFHITKDQVTRYLRDRRLLKGLKVLEKYKTNIRDGSVLLVCGGVGGESVFF